MSAQPRFLLQLGNPSWLHRLLVESCRVRHLLVGNNRAITTLRWFGFLVVVAHCFQELYYVGTLNHFRQIGCYISSILVEIFLANMELPVTGGLNIRRVCQPEFVRAWEGEIRQSKDKKRLFARDSSDQIVKTALQGCDSDRTCIHWRW